ncbi:unnamed protein product [Choristocarpus tenellus]
MFYILSHILCHLIIFDVLHPSPFLWHFKTDLFLKNPLKFTEVVRAHVEQHARPGASSAANQGIEGGGTGSNVRTEAASMLVSGSGASSGVGPGAANGTRETRRDSSPAAAPSMEEGKGQIEVLDHANGRSSIKRGNSCVSSENDIANNKGVEQGTSEGGRAGSEGDVGDEGIKVSPDHKLAKATGEEVQEEDSGEDASSDDGAWSDSDEDSAEYQQGRGGIEGSEEAPLAKRARAG